MVLRKTSSPVRKKKNFKNKKIKKNLLVVSYRKKQKTPTFSTDTTYCSVKEFSLPKKKKKTKKQMLKAGVDILLSDAVFLLVSDDGLLIINR